MLSIKNEKEIALMAEAGHRLAEVLSSLRDAVRPGITTKELDSIAHEHIMRLKSTPAFLGYRPSPHQAPYPATLCASVNDVVVHGIPSGRVLKEGDLISLDLGLIYKGFYSDSAISVGVGEIAGKAKALLETTEAALFAGIEAACAGNTLGDVGYAIQGIVEGRGFSVAELLTGHGIGRHLHEDPTVFNTGRPGKGEEIVPGMVIAIEPMVIAGSGRVTELPDGSFAAKDHGLAAHFEHTVAITPQGPRVLTQI